MIFKRKEKKMLTKEYILKTARLLQQTNADKRKMKPKKKYSIWLNLKDVKLPNGDVVIQK